MEDVLELARRLGQEIRRSERYRLLRQAEEKVLTDLQARDIQDSLEKQLRKIRDCEAQMKPVEVADKRELSRLQQAARTHPNLQELLKVQADYFEMMNKVNDAILQELMPPHESAPAEEQSR
jgi:cell fate (sporulation/competence/biofilm development) regulator YlbF (YheA/YmcA/DUF963 family)